MNPNPEIWGAPDTWVNDYIIKSQDFPQYKAGKPKNAAFRSLMNGSTQNKTPYPEPIDKTICPVGQDPLVSCFGKVYTMSGDSVDDNNNFTPETTIEFEKPVNWCFSSGGPATQGWEIRNGFNSVYPPPSTWRWSPNTGELNTNENRNAGVMPFVFYQLKSLLLSIQILTVDGHATAEYGSTPTNSIGWKTLAEWKNSYSNKSIYSIRFNINWCTTANDSNIAYSGDTQTLGSFDTLQVSLLDGVNLISGSSELYYDYATYQMAAKNNSFYLTSVYTSPRYTPTRRYYLLSADKFENAVLHSTRGSSNNYWSNTWYEIPYSENNYEAIMKMVACFGCPFTDSDKLSFRLDYTDTELCIPVIDSDGITHGEYTRGTANTTNDIYNADSVRDKNYDPSKPPTPIDPNTYSNITGFNTVSTNAALTKRYVLDAANVEKLADDLWTICSELSSTDFEHFEGKLKDEFLTQNPIDCIISLQRFPFQIPGLGTKAPIRLGKSEGSAQGYTTYFIFNTILFSGKQIFPRFGNCFLDYEPYTSYEIYVPFCGTRKLRAEDLIGHTVNVHMQIDLITGSCTAYIMADELVIETLNGSCAVDQQLSGAQTATMNANIFNGILAQKQTDKIEGMNIAKTWLPGNWVSDLIDPMGNAMRMSNAMYEAQKANYDITHVQVPPHKIGAASPLLGWYQEFDARIIIYYPEGDVINSSIPPSLNAQALATFGHLKGFGTVTPGTVSQFRGDVSKSWYLQGDIIADGIPCTDSERKRIKSMFAAGVYI